MEEVSIQQLRDGQVLAEDLVDPGGEVLLSKGSPVGRNLIPLLERRGVLTVKIEDELDSGPLGGPGAEEASGTGDIGVALSRLDHMFEGMGDDPLMRAIYRAARGMLERAGGGR